MLSGSVFLYLIDFCFLCGTYFFFSNLVYYKFIRVIFYQRLRDIYFNYYNQVNANIKFYNLLSHN